MFARLGSWCFRRRWVVVIAWVVGVLVVGATSSAMGGNFGQDFTPSGFESTNGLDTLERGDRRLRRGHPRHDRVPRRAGGRRPRGRGADDGAVHDRQAIAADPDVDLSDPAFDWLSDEQRDALEAADLELWEGMTLASPYEPTPEPQVATEGPERRQDRLRVARGAGHRLGRRLRPSPSPCRSSSRRSTACRSSSAGPPSASSRSPSPRPSVSPSRS